jgi:hypothetical protein
LQTIEQSVEINQIGLRPKRFEIGFQNIGEIPRIKIWILVRYEACVSEMPKSIEKSSNAGITAAAVNVVIIAWKATRNKLMFFLQLSVSIHNVE